jgi:hypothetical protein
MRPTQPPVNRACIFRIALSIASICLSVSPLLGTEGGGSVYPVGVETVLPGMTPPPGVTLFEEFNTTYQAGRLLGPQGESRVPGFKLGVYAFAPKFVHNWGVHVLGGDLVSAFALPLIAEHLELPTFTGTKTGFSNPELGVAYVAYDHRAWHWWYGLDVYTPGFGYHKGDAINIGQHNFATVPVAAFTYLPDRGKAEVSSRFQYIVNYNDPATHYRSGDEFTWEYVGMINITKKLAVGANGYLYQQATNDWQDGSPVAGGNRGRDFAVGPEVRCHFGHVVLIAKYQRDTLVQNRPEGNALWIEFAVPISRGQPKQEAQRLSRSN